MRLLTSKENQQAGAELCQAQESLGLSGLDQTCAFLQFAKLAYEFDFCSICQIGAFDIGIAWVVWVGLFGSDGLV